MEILDISKLPMYNMDTENRGFPALVEKFKSSIRSADGIVVATPEYNYSIPGVLKNSIDWVSRPPDTIPFEGKPGVIMSASTSRFGGARAQQHLRQILAAVGVQVMTQPELYIPQANKIFLEKQPLDPWFSEKIQKFAEASANFIHRCHL